jgi:peptidoglycan/LPS O-acetylase OafA/YrhL
MNALLSPAALPNGPPPLHLLPVLAILVIALALVAYRTVEAPGIDLGRRIIRRLRQKGAVASVRNDAGVAPVAVPTGTETLS